MQADYFRLCALFARGGLWIDADFEPLRPLSDLLDCAPQAMMLEWDGFFGTGLMLFRKPEDRFVGTFLELATANIEARILPSALHAAGPVLADALRGVLDPAWFARFLAEGEDLLVVSRRKLVNKIRPRVQVTQALLDAYRAMTIVALPEAFGHIRLHDPPYKQAERHWTNWKGPVYVPHGPDDAPIAPAD
jgi:hypothetical protein